MTDGTFKHSENFPKRKYRSSGTNTLVLCTMCHDKKIVLAKGKRRQLPSPILKYNQLSFTVMQTMHGDESLLGYNSNTQVLNYSDGQNQPERFKQGNSYFFVFYTG